MRKYAIFILFVIQANLFSNEYIKINYEYFLKDDSVDKTEIILNFDSNGYLEEFLSTRNVLNQIVEKKITGTKKNNTFQLDIDVRNDFNMNPPDLQVSYLFKKTKYGWDDFLLSNNQLLKKITIDDLNKSINEILINGDNKCIYKQNNNTVELYNNIFTLANGFYSKKNLDKESGEKYIFHWIDNHHFILDSYYEGHKTEYKVEYDYSCKFIDQIELLSTLKNWDVPMELMPFIVIPLPRIHHTTSYLTKGTTTYEPEHMQYKDGLPWACGNGKGIGEVISIKEFEHKNPTRLIIMNGYQDINHPDYYEKNSRVKQIKATNKISKKSKIINIKDIREEQVFSLSDLEDGNEYDFEILYVYAGTKHDDLCIQYFVLE